MPDEKGGEIKAIEAEIQELYAIMANYEQLSTPQFQKSWAIVSSRLNSMKDGIHAMVQAGADAQAHAYANGQLFIIDKVLGVPAELQEGVKDEVEAQANRLRRLKQLREAAAALEHEA